MEIFTIENDWCEFIEHGWGNGYVAVPPTSKLHSLNYNELDVTVHGGLTLAISAKEFKRLPEHIPKDYWIFGFDTVHAFDNQKEHDYNYVLKETENLREQLIELESKININ